MLRRLGWALHLGGDCPYHVSVVRIACKTILTISRIETECVVRIGHESNGCALLRLAICQICCALAR